MPDTRRFNACLCVRGMIHKWELEGELAAGTIDSFQGAAHYRTYHEQKRKIGGTAPFYGALWPAPRADPDPVGRAVSRRRIGRWAETRRAARGAGHGLERRRLRRGFGDPGGRLQNAFLGAVRL